MGQIIVEYLQEPQFRVIMRNPCKEDIVKDVHTYSEAVEVLNTALLFKGWQEAEIRLTLYSNQIEVSNICISKYSISPEETGDEPEAAPICEDNNDDK